MKRIEKPLTAGQTRALLAFRAAGVGCSLMEWAEQAAVSYTTIEHHRRALVAGGYLTSQPGKARTTRLTDLGTAALAAIDNTN